MDEMIKKVLANIPTIMDKTSFSESFFEMVLKKLVFLGYTLKETDSWGICFTIQKVENHIKNSCNVTHVPDGLYNTAADMVCGEFLFMKKQTGQLEITDLDLTDAIASIKEGDVNVSFNVGMSDEAKFGQLLNYLIANGEGELVRYRKNKMVKMRKAIESLYDGSCTIIEYQKVQKENKSTGFEEVTVLEKQPCRLSFSTITNNASDETGASSVTQIIKVFLSPKITVKPGSKLIITQNHVTNAYKSSGKPAMYSTHQEIVLELFKEWS